MVILVLLHCIILCCLSCFLWKEHSISIYREGLDLTLSILPRHTEKDFPMHSLGNDWWWREWPYSTKTWELLGEPPPLPSWASGKIMMTDLASSSFSSCFLPTSSSCFQESTWFNQNSLWERQAQCGSLSNYWWFTPSVVGVPVYWIIWRNSGRLSRTWEN